MSERKRLLKSIAAIIADYRAGDIDIPTPEHVEEWISQFDEDVRVPMLTELDHVLDHTYYSKATVERFLSSLASNKKLAGDDPCSFWRKVAYLDIQTAGSSQREMLRMLGSTLQEQCGIRIEDCGTEPDVYLYLDDGIFTGNRIRNDLKAWVQVQAPSVASLHVVTIAQHSGGQFYASTGIQEAARACGKKVDIQWWRSVEIEDRKTYVHTSDVLRPTSVPDDELTKNYVATLAYNPVLRRAGSVGTNKFFSSEEGRNLLEQEFLMAGARVRDMCPYLNEYQRPLGNSVLATLGFGSLFVTFRNCPNNAPLALWAGDPWYPLFPRKTN